MLFKQSSGIHFIYLFSEQQNEKLNKIPTNAPAKIFYQVDNYLQTQNVCKVMMDSQMR